MRSKVSAQKRHWQDHIPTGGKILKEMFKDILLQKNMNFNRININLSISNFLQQQQQQQQQQQ
jgi:hypothetical protein